MARLSLANALLDDLRPVEARHVLSELLEEDPRPPAMVARARLLLARSLELQGDREAAVTAYQRASAASDPEVRSLAHAALRNPPSAAQLRGLQSLAKARRLEEAGDSAAAVSAYREAARAWPEGAEAPLRVAEDDLRHGRTAGVREIVARVAGGEAATPAWLRAFAHLLRGQLADLQQDRKVALTEYKIVFKAPMGRHELRTRAADGLDRPYVPAMGGSSGANVR
jgi:tetratricopeptide (TPR) repeat protein